jgi:hypothetical protein
MLTGNVCREFPVSSAHVCVQSTKMLSFCDNKYFPSWKDDVLGYLSMDLKSFYVQLTQGEVKDLDGQVKHRSDLDELLGMSTVSMDFDVASVEGESQLQAYMQVQQVPNDTDPLMWWKGPQEFPDLARMARQYLTVLSLLSLVVAPDVRPSGGVGLTSDA